MKKVKMMQVDIRCASNVNEYGLINECFFGKKASLIPLPHRLYIPLQPTFPRGKAGIESRIFSCKTGKISNIKRVGKCNLCIVVSTVEDRTELIIKGDFDTVGFGVV